MMNKVNNVRKWYFELNEFISTTTDQPISTFYANKPYTKPNVVSVVYEITIDSS